MANNLSNSYENERPNAASIIHEDARREGWSAQTLGHESTYEEVTEIARRLRRGDETLGDPNTRDFPSVSHDEEASRIRKGPDARLDSKADLIGRAPLDTRLNGEMGSIVSRALHNTSSSTTLAPPVDRDVELRQLLQAYAKENHFKNAGNDYSKFVHFAPHTLLHNSIAAVLRHKSRQQIGMIAQHLAESYLEVDRERAFAKMLDSPGPPPAGFHRGMTPAEIGTLVPQLAARNSATIDRLAELIAGDPGRARQLGPELLAEILKMAANTIVTDRHTGARAAA